ncbi:MAG TPA: cation transporter, partial [Mycobacteriales bacterium]
RAVVGPDEHTSTTKFVIVYVVLALSLVFESVSLTRAVRQVRREAVQAGRRFLVYVLRSPDPTVKTVASEDTAAVIGIVIAAAGTALHQATGSDMWEGIASFLIAGLLAYVALALGRDTKELLIGEAADPAVRLVALDVIAAHGEVDRVAEILTMQLGPTSVLVAARLQFMESLRARDIERVCTEIEREMRRRVPALQQVFLDPSTVTDDQLAAGRDLLAENVEEVRRLDGADADILRRLEAVRSARTRAARRLTG